MKAKFYQRVQFVLMLLLIVCAFPVRLHAQSHGPPLVTASVLPQGGNGYIFSGQVDPNSDGTASAWFEWGTTTAYGNTTSPASYPSSFSYQPFSTYFSGSFSTTYHMRGVGSNYLGIGYSSDVVFTVPGVVGGATIDTQPQSQTVAAGAPVTFTVAASSSQPKTYQWQKNGIDIDAATFSSFGIEHVQPSDAGAYVVLVKAYYGGDVEAISSVATLNVTPSSSPTLQVGSTNGSLVLSWPAYQPGYNLLTSTNPYSGSWTNVSSTPFTNNGTATVTLPAADAQRFFRLQYP